MADVEALQAEIEALRAELHRVHTNNDLFLILLLFLVVISATTVIHLWPTICSVWHEYKELVYPAAGQPVHGATLVHDMFNLAVLPGIVALDINFLLGGNLADHYNPKFWVFFWYTVTYVIVDMVWVALLPRSVKSPPTIIVHHGVTLLYLGIPAYNGLTRYVMAADLFVELNTWFLIVRRQPIARRGVLQIVNSWLFYTSWFSIRCIAYPYLIYEVYQLFLNHVHALRDKSDPAWYRSQWGLTYMVIPLVFQTTLTFLNVHWTIQLIKGAVRRQKPDKGL